MMKSIKFAAYAAVALLSLTDVSSAQTVTDIQLSCSAEGARDFSMDARYRVRRGRRTFDASFEAAPRVGFTAGQVLGVAVGGVAVGRIVLKTDVGGDLVGDLEFHSNLAEGNPFPATFPAVRSGTSVTVGPLGCALR